MIMKHLLRWLLKAVLLAAIITFTLLLAWAFQSRTMPALHLWHTVFLSEEFTADDLTQRSTLLDYLAREERLFQELKTKVYDRTVFTEDMNLLSLSRWRASGSGKSWAQLESDF